MSGIYLIENTSHADELQLSEVICSLAASTFNSNAKNVNVAFTFYYYSKNSKSSPILYCEANVTTFEPCAVLFCETTRMSISDDIHYSGHNLTKAPESYIQTLLAGFWPQRRLSAL